VKVPTTRVLTFAVVAGLFSVLIGSALPMQAFGHALNIKSIDVDGVGERGVFIVLGHTNEPSFGAFPGIHDGKHGVEVFLEDLDTALPLAGSNLQIDKYYFEDIASFNAANSPEDADEKEKGVALSGVFGDPGHYVARQVTDDGIYGYRLYGTVNYFSVAEMPIDTTVFCTQGGEGGGGSDTSKFNSPGWFGAYGCQGDIENIFFPEKLSNVEDDDNGNGGGEGGGDRATITVESQHADGSEFKKFVEISDESGKVVKKGFTPIEFEGKVGDDHTIEVRFQGSPQFDHWEDGSDKRKRTITLEEDVTLVATYGNDKAAKEASDEDDQNNNEDTNSTTTKAASTLNSGQIIQTSLSTGSAGSASTFTNIAATPHASSQGLLELVTMIGIPSAGIAGVLGLRSFRQKGRNSQP
jgi:hypothetical protein